LYILKILVETNQIASHMLIFAYILVEKYDQSKSNE
jgi:hypothetical protein